MAEIKAILTPTTSEPNSCWKGFMTDILEFNEPSYPFILEQKNAKKQTPYSCHERLLQGFGGFFNFASASSSEPLIRSTCRPPLCSISTFSTCSDGDLF